MIFFFFSFFSLLFLSEIFNQLFLPLIFLFFGISTRVYVDQDEKLGVYIICRGTCCRHFFFVFVFLHPPPRFILYFMLHSSSPLPGPWLHTQNLWFSLGGVIGGVFRWGKKEKKKKEVLSNLTV